MHFTLGDMDIQIEKSWYNKTKVQEDGITQIVDTSKKYSYYQVGIWKNYLNVTDSKDMLKQLIADLKTVTSELEQQLEYKEKDSDCEQEVEF